MPISTMSVKPGNNSCPRCPRAPLRRSATCYLRGGVVLWRERINARGRKPPDTVVRMPLPLLPRAHRLSVLLGVAGMSHFALPMIYDVMIPSQLPGPPRAWTYGSGACELAVAAALALPRTRRIGGLAAAGLFIGVLPGNLQMAYDAQRGTSRDRKSTRLNSSHM